MRNEISLRTWIERFNNGDFDAKDVATQIDAGWYNWFCKDNSLLRKLNEWVTLSNSSRMVGRSNLIRIMFGSRIAAHSIVNYMTILE